MSIIRIDDPADPRIAAFRDIKERDLTGRQGLFVAEGEVVLRVLASSASRCRTRAVLLAQGRVTALSVVAEATGAPVFAAPQEVLDGIAGFHLHRGILAIGEKPCPIGMTDYLADLPARALIVAACGIGNHDNMGGIFRNAAAFGADAVVLDDTCCDPFYRKAIRVSVGGVLRTPFIQGGPARDMVDALLGAGFEVAAMTPGAGATLDQVARAPRTAVLLGAEGPGLSPEIIARCRPAAIRMRGGFDSLNVATTAALALHHFARSG